MNDYFFEVLGEYQDFDTKDKITEFIARYHQLIFAYITDFDKQTIKFTNRTVDKFIQKKTE